jgi:ornithine cyclodeaminase/alanine dehydrogenase-like protein (mu-crystallin family)
MHVISEEQIRSAVRPVELVAAMRSAFIDVSAGRIRTTFGLLELDDGDVHLKAASAVNGPMAVVKVSSWVPSNRQRHLPTGSGGVLVLNACTGAPIVFLADGGHLTNARTAAAGALTTDLLASASARTVAVLGAGLQAELQVLTLAELRKFERLLIWARRQEAALELAGRLDKELPAVAVTAVDRPRDAVEGAEIVITATASQKALIEGDWLRPGQHVTAMGADDAAKRELDLACLRRADRLVVDLRRQTCATAEIGAAIQDGTFKEDGVVELGEVLTGSAEGRRDDTEITIGKLTGLAAQDLAAARFVLEPSALL